MMWCAAGSYWLVVDAHHDRDVLALGRRGDDDLPGAGRRCAWRASAALVNRPVDSITMSTPRSPQGSCGRVALGQHLDRVRAGRDASPSAADRQVQRAEHRVVLQQVRARVDVAQVVGGDDLDSRPAPALHGAPEVPADPAESVDSYPHSHGCVLLCMSVIRYEPTRRRAAPPARLRTYRKHRPACQPASGRDSRRGRAQGTSMSAVRRASVVGHAQLGGPPVGQRQQPPDPARDRVLGQRRVGQLAELLQAGLTVLDPQLARHDQVLRGLLAEDLQGPLDPGAGGDRGPRAAPQVGVVEVGQPVGGGPHLAAHPALLPGQHAVVGAEPGQQRADRVAVPDHHPVHPAHLARLGVDLQPPGRADHGQRHLRPRAGHLERHRPARLGQRAVGEERAAPGRLAVAGGAGDHLPRQPAHRPAVVVDQAGLPGQALAVLAPPGPRSGCPCAARPAPARSARRHGRRPRRCPCAAAAPRRRCRARPRPRSGRRPGAGRRRTAAASTPRPCGSTASAR